MKKCTSCGENKSLGEFAKRTDGRNGLRSDCRECQGEVKRKWYENHKEEVKEKTKRWKTENAERVRELCRMRYAESSEVEREKRRKWIINNPEKARDIYKRRNTKVRGTIKGRLSSNISTAMRISLRESKGGRHWEDLVGYTVEQLKIHLGRRFKHGMTWGNYGSFWHIDHIVPISAFNYETPDDIDFKKCWSLNNLQPLEAVDNWSKNNKLDKPFQPSLAMQGV